MATWGTRTFGKRKYRFDATYKTKTEAKARANKWRKGLQHARVVKNWAGNYDVFVTAPLGAKPGAVGHLYKT